MFRFVPVIAVAAASAGAQPVELFQPDSAVTGSSFSSAYAIENAINGSGLPAGFGPDDPHATYVQGNHWTTASGALAAGDAWATFFFDAPVTVGTFFLWNHRSDGVAADPNYEVTLFDLVLRDAGGSVLAEFRGLDALPDTAVAQAYAFAPVGGVASVDFIIRANAGSSYTGVAEVAFAAVPAPGTLALLATGAVAARRRRR